MHFLTTCVCYLTHFLFFRFSILCVFFLLITGLLRGYYHTQMAKCTPKYYVVLHRNLLKKKFVGKKNFRGRFLLIYLGYSSSVTRNLRFYVYYVLIPTLHLIVLRHGMKSFSRRRLLLCVGTLRQEP